MKSININRVCLYLLQSISTMSVFIVSTFTMSTFTMSITSISIYAVSLPAYSEDCLVATDARSIMGKHPQLESEILIATEGRYSAVMKNGDIVLASFATCDLGLSAHYFSVERLNDNELKDRLNMFLKHVLASETVISEVMPQLEKLTTADFNQAVVLDGPGDQHQLTVIPADSPVYKQHIQYVWLPPEH